MHPYHHVPQFCNFQNFPPGKFSVPLCLVCQRRPFRAESSPGCLTQRITVTPGLLPPRASSCAFQPGSLPARLLQPFEQYPRLGAPLCSHTGQGLCVGRMGGHFCLELLLLLRCKDPGEVRRDGAYLSGSVSCASCRKQGRTQAIKMQATSGGSDPGAAWGEVDRSSKE